MADLDLDALEALRAAATQGEWSPICNLLRGEWRPGVIREHTARPCTTREDADLSCAAVNNLPALLSLARTGAADAVDLLALRQQVEDTVGAAQTEADAEGWITAYHFKTGAIHRLLAKARDIRTGQPQPFRTAMPSGPQPNSPVGERADSEGGRSSDGAPAHSYAARVPSGSDAEAAVALLDVLADCENGTAAHKDCSPPSVAHIAAELARAREEERERAERARRGLANAASALKDISGVRECDAPWPQTRKFARDQYLAARRIFDGTRALATDMPKEKP